jgi:hypothetical protein
VIANRGAATREPVNQAATITPSPQDPRPVCATSPFTDVTSLDTNSTSESNHEALTVETLKATANVLGLMKSPGEERKERSRKRLRESLEKSPLPDYQVKGSKKWPLQQKAIGWITQAGKQHFDEYFANLLARLGVKGTHQGTCILCPADFAFLDPLTLAAMFKAENCPLAWAEGIVSISLPLT